MFQKLAPLHAKAILIIVVLLAFGACIQNGYSLDDQFVTTPENSQVSKGLAGIPEILTSTYSESNGKPFGYRPVAELTFALEHALFGFNPALSHLISLLLYVLCVLVAFRLLRDLMSDYPWWLAFVACLIFALHPLHSEVVFSLKNRDELLSALFGLLCFQFILSFVIDHSWIKLLWAIAFAFLSYFAKITFIPFMFLVPGTLLAFGHLRLKAAIVCSVAMGVLIMLMNQLRHFAMGNIPTRVFDYAENPLQAVSYLERLPTAFYTFLLYLKLHLVPQPLLAYYGAAHVKLQSWSAIYPYVGMILLLAAGLLWLYALGKNKLLSGGIIIYLTAISPYMNFPLVSPGIIAERFAFLSVLGFSVVIASLIYTIHKRFASRMYYVWGGLSLILIWFAWLSFSRAGDWNSLDSLLAADVAKAPNSIKLNTAYADRLHANLAGAPMSQQKIEQSELAARHYLQAIKLYPSLTGAYNNLGILCMEMGQYQNAVANFSKALKIDPKDSQGYFYLGAGYEMLGDTEAAFDAYNTCLEINPNHVRASQALQRLKG